MSLGVQKTLDTINGLKDLSLTLIGIAKGGITLGDLPKAFSVIGEIKVLVDSAPSALPELKDLDSAEVGLVCESAYKAVKAIIDEVSVAA